MPVVFNQSKRPEYRTFWQTMAYMGICAFLGFAGIQNGSDLLGLTALCGGIGAGMTGIKWGRAQEHKAANGNGKPEGA